MYYDRSMLYLDIKNIKSIIVYKTKIYRPLKLAQGAFSKFCDFRFYGYPKLCCCVFLSFSGFGFVRCIIFDHKVKLHVMQVSFIH